MNLARTVLIWLGERVLARSLNMAGRERFWTPAKHTNLSTSCEFSNMTESVWRQGCRLRVTALGWHLLHMPWNMIRLKEWQSTCCICPGTWLGWKSDNLKVNSSSSKCLKPVDSTLSWLCTPGCVAEWTYPAHQRYHIDSDHSQLCAFLPYSFLLTSFLDNCGRT